MEEITTEPAAEDEEGVEGDNETPVTEPETISEEEPAATPEEEAVETPEVTSEEDSEEAPAETTVENEINAVADTESTISIEYKTDDKDAEGNAIAGKESEAEVVFLGGCVSSDKKLAEGRDLRFKVEPAAGRVLTKVEHQIGEATSGTTIEADVNDVYKVDKSAFTVGGKAVNGKIIVTTQAVEYTVKFAKSTDDGSVAAYKIYPVVTEATSKTLGTEITDSTETKLVYGKSGEFAVELTGDPVVNKLVSITLGSAPITVSSPVVELAEKDNADSKHKVYTFTVDPSTADGLKDATKNGDANVAVKVVAKVKLTVAAIAADATHYTVEGIANATETQINYDGSKFSMDTFVEDAADLDNKSLVFKVTPADNYKVKDVTAETKPTSADSDTAGTAVTVTKTAATDGSYNCTIALSSLKGFSVDTTLTISIETEPDTAKPGVHTITFKDKYNKAPAHVTIKHGAAAADTTLTSGSVPVIGDEYKISVTPDKGYELAKGTITTGEGQNNNKYVVTVKESRTYTEVKEGETVTAPAITKDVSTEYEAYADKEAKAITLKFKDSDKNYADGAETVRAYTVKDVEVIVNATVTKNTAEKLVYFDNQLEADYKITTEGVIHNEEVDEDDLADSWVIPATVDELTFTVTSAKEPVVSVIVENDEGEEEAEEVTGTVADGVYTYSYPAAALDAESTILIADKGEVKTKAVKVKVNPEDVTVKYDKVIDWENLTKDADGYYPIDSAAKVGKEITLNFIPKSGVTIDKVSYTMGEEKGNGTVNRDGSVSLSLTVTDEVTVDVESKSDYSVILTKDNEPLTKQGDAYVADYTDKNIVIALTKADVTQTTKFYDVVVKDGAKTAATEAKVNDDGTATIAEIAESERGKDLTIEVYTNKSTKYTTTLKTNIVSEEVTVSRMVNGKDTKVAEDATVDIMPDAKMAFTVTPAKGASLSDLDFEILAKDGANLTTETSPIASDETSFANGTLTVTTKPGVAKDTEVLVSIFNKNAEKKDGKNVSLKGGKFVLKLTDPLVKTAEISKVNATAGSATNRAVRLNVSVDFKNKKNPPAAPNKGDLYYKVDFTVPTGAPANVTVIPATTKYVKVDDYANTAKTIELALVTANTEDKPATESTAAVIADIAEQISTTAKVTLVQSLSDKNLAAENATVTEADYVAGPEAAMKDNTLTTKKPVYETKLSVKAVNGATVFTGQSDAKVATPVFGKDTSYDNITVQFVDYKTNVLRGYSGTGVGDEAYYDGHFCAWVADDNSIHVGIDAYEDEYHDGIRASDYKTLGVKVTAAGPDDSYKASAVVKLKVQQGIFDVDVDERKASLPETIFKDPKKAASVKITPLLNGGDPSRKPAKAAVTWEIDTASNNDSAYAKAALTGKKPLVSVKNGTVSISKDYKVQTAREDNMFTVTIRANDFDGNGETVYHEYGFEITDQKNEISKLVIKDSEDKEIDPASLTAEDFDYSNNQNWLRVVAEDAKGYRLPVTFKSSNAKAVAVDEYGYLTFYKPADKIKITATTVDGGKAPKKELTINVKPYKQVGLKIVGDDSTSGLGETDIHYSGGCNEKYTLYPYYEAGNDWNQIDLYGYKNLKITVKGGKFIANSNWAKSQGYYGYMGYAVVVTDKSGKATVTITDTANKDKKTNHKDYTITNDNPTAVKAPSIKLYDPKKVEYGTRAITWQVTDRNNDNYAGSYVKLTPDYTVASNSASNIVGNSGKVLKIDENGRFTLSSTYVYRGTYKMIATVGTMVGGEFVASAKDVKLNFSIPVKKYNSNLTVKNSYTLDAKSTSYAKIDVKTDYDYTVSNAMNVIKKVQGKDDHTNRFTEFFEVKNNRGYKNNSSGNYAYISLKSDLSAEQIEYITSKEGKDDCTGYITVTNYNYNAMNTKDVQVKISFKANKYSLTNATIFSNGTANTSVTATVRLMNGKNPDYVALAWVDATDDGRFLATGDDWATFNGADITLKSKAAAIAPGKYDVKLIVVPQNSSYVKAEPDPTPENPNRVKWIWANDKVGADGKVLTVDQMVAKAGIPVTAKIEVKAVDTKSIAKAKNLNVTLSTQLYDDSNGNGYVRATSTTGGYYQVDVPYTIAIEGSDISATAGDVKVNLTNKAGENQNEITVAANSKEELVKATKAYQTIDYDSEGKPIQRPVIRLQVSKKALLALSAMDAKDKPITAYGKKLKVPVEIKYTNGITTTDTLNFNITMPKKAPASFEDVQKTIADNQAVIEKIQTRIKSTAKLELTALIEDVYAKVSSLVPADTDVTVSYEETKKYLNDGKEAASGDADTELVADDYTSIMDAGKAKITLTLTDLTKASANTKDVSFNYTLGINAKSSDLNAVKTAIENFAGASSEYKFTNDTTAATLLADIKAADSVKELLGARKGHLSLMVKTFTRNPATTLNKGTFTAEIQVKDLVNGGTPAIANVGAYNNIAKLSTLTEAKTAVKGFFTNEKVTELVNNCSGQETIIKDAILKAANEKAGNKDIKIEFKANAGTTKGWYYEEPQAAVEKVEGEDGTEITPAKPAEPAKISFILVLTKAQEDGSRSAEVAFEEISIDIDAAKCIAPEAMKAKVNDEITVAKLKDIATTADNNEAAIKTALETTFATLTSGAVGYELTWAKKAGTTPEKDDFTYEPATQGKAAKLSFKVVLTFKGTGKSEIISVENAEVLEGNEKYQTPAELLSAAKTELAKGIDYVETEQLALEKIKDVVKAQSKNTAYEVSGIKVEATPNTAEEGQDSNGTAFNAATEAAEGSITKVIITIDDETKDTIASIKIAKKPAATPAD